MPKMVPTDPNFWNTPTDQSRPDRFAHTLHSTRSRAGTQSLVSVGVSEALLPRHRLRVPSYLGTELCDPWGNHDNKKPIPNGTILNHSELRSQGEAGELYQCGDIPPSWAQQTKEAAASTI